MPEEGRSIADDVIAELQRAGRALHDFGEARLALEERPQQQVSVPAMPPVPGGSSCIALLIRDFAEQPMADLMASVNSPSMTVTLKSNDDNALPLAGREADDDAERLRC
ncbi:MAG: hypothetical protein QOH65_3251 [Methylobacteriaceae bacterium]|nr:hypothetical protein [Methylobacteriaceae bacterium]